MIKVADGDKVQIVVKNELPQSTSVHFHGIEVPNAMDVPYITRTIKPGGTFAYAFTARGPAVGMYHSHDYALGQVPDDRRCLHRGRRATARRLRTGGPGAADDAQRHRCDRVLAQRQVVPGDHTDRHQRR